jgi:hypothetical protein
MDSQFTFAFTINDWTFPILFLTKPILNMIKMTSMFTLWTPYNRIAY